jgi:integrative and conjugative element protein (TIGR02256 family)
MIARFVTAKRGFKQMESDILARPGVETGGLFPGRVIGDALVTPFTITGGPKALRAPARFSPDVVYQQSLLDHAFENFRCTFVGAWHRHPGRFDVPSAVDLATARHIVTDADWDLVQAVFPIAIVRDKEVRVRAFLMHRDELEFFEIPFEVVPDDDPLILKVLSGSAAKLEED